MSLSFFPLDEVLSPQRVKNLRGKIPVHVAAGASRTAAVLRMFRRALNRIDKTDSHLSLLSFPLPIGTRMFKTPLAELIPTPPPFSLSAQSMSSAPPPLSAAPIARKLSFSTLPQPASPAEELVPEFVRITLNYLSQDGTKREEKRKEGYKSIFRLSTNGESVSLAWLSD